MTLEKTIEGEDGAPLADPCGRFDELSSRFLSCPPDFLGDKYEVLGILGRGGMGTVLKIRHLAMGRVRAAKLLNLSFVLDEEKVVERFRREAILVSEMSHPNIVKVFDLDVARDGTPFMTMEHLEGEDFDAVIARRGRIPYRETVRLLAGVADALDMVHGHGIVHRDLKPSNLFLTARGSVKVLDFGISHVEDGNARLTNAGEVVGTPMYIAPEQMQSEPVDARADVYSVAAMAYHMITGTTVFEAKSLGELVAKIVGMRPPPAGSRVPDLPAHVEEALERGLAKRPADRFPTVKDFVRALAGPDLHEMESGVRRILAPDELLSGTMPMARRGGHLKRRALAVGAAVVIVAAILAAWSWVILGGSGGPDRVEVELGPVLIEGEWGQDEWLRAAVDHLVEAHLKLDPGVELIGRADGGEGGGSEERAGPPGGYELRTAVRSLEDGAAVTLELVPTDPAEPVRRTTAEGTGLEAAIEEATWELAGGMPRKPGAKAVKDRAMLAAQLEGALKAGLWERSRRLADYLGGASEAAESTLEVRRLACRYAGSREACAGEGEKEDASTAGPTETICSDHDTFPRRLACIEDSVREDDPRTALTYLWQFMERDWANGLLLSAASFAPMRDHLADLEKWLVRARWRHGATSPLVAESEFFLRMNARDTQEALIWARRSPRPGMREGLALQLEGWLRAGVEQATRGAVAEAAKQQRTRGRLAAEEILRPTIYPPLIARSPVLARAWLEGAETRGQAGPTLARARELVSAIEDPDGDMCARDREATAPFTLETDYLCGRWAALLEEAAGNPSRGETGRAVRFLIAEAKMRLGDTEAALEEFERIESDPATRVSQPFTSLLALARIGRLAEERGDAARAARVYAELLSSWEGLDIPLDEHLEIQLRAQRLRVRIERDGTVNDLNGP